MELAAGPVLGGLLLGDVDADAHQADNLAPIVPQRVLGDPEPDRVAVRVGAFVFLHGHRAAFADDGVVLPFGLLDQIRRIQIPVVFAQHLGFVTGADKIKLGPVRQDLAPVTVLDVDVDRQVVDDGAQQLLTFLQ